MRKKIFRCTSFLVIAALMTATLTGCSSRSGTQNASSPAQGTTAGEGTTPGIQVEVDISWT